MNKRLIESHAMPCWEDLPITQIKRRDVIALLDKVMDRGTPSAARHLFAAIRKLFNWSAERNLIEFSPCAYVKSPSKSNERDRVLNDNEIRAIWGACEKEGYAFGKLLQFLLVTGQRLREVSNMTWKEIDLKEKVWRLPRERVKSNRSHEVPLSSLAIEILESLPRFESVNGKNEGDNFVFTTTCGRVPFSGFSKGKEQLDKACKVTGWRIHDLRRTAGTNLAKLGVPVSTISKVLNHASSGVTAIYNRHSYLLEKTEALEKWANYLKEKVNSNGASKEEYAIK